jgi:beta-lactamase superfamily II metal-dependent hydrolase
VIEVAFLNVANADSVVIYNPKSRGAVIDVPQPRLVFKWFRQHNCIHIEHIFLTHNHNDHAPPLPKLVNFLVNWLESGTVKHLILPRAYLDKAFVQARDIERSSGKEHKHALDALEAMLDRQQLIIVPAEQSITTPTMGEVSFQILYPSVLDAVPTKGNENALSLVLQLKYGAFTMLLPADIDGIGLAKLLKRSENLHSHVVKIPQHGAWPRHSEENWRQLLDNSDPEFAVLSVGSRNSYEHVKPELFQDLWVRQQSPNTRLKKFVCTEVTRTCVFTALIRRRMGSSGLIQRHPCCGDVIITANKDGSWTFLNEQEHVTRLKNVEMPACLGKADLQN